MVLRTALTLSLISSFVISAQAEVQLEKLKLPKGFEMSVYADGVKDARSLDLGPNKMVFVGTRSNGSVYALVPNKDAKRASEVKIIAKGLDMPNGVAVLGDDLFVAENSRIIKYPNIANKPNKPPKPVEVLAGLPNESHHGWRYITFGPENWLYLAIGAPCNICLSQDERFASIARLKPDGKAFEIYAHGVRNSVGMAFDPQTKDLWFTDNGRDWLGDESPPDELNHAAKKGLHFGYPFIHGEGISDPEFASKKPKSLEVVPPAKALGPHVAALGLRFYQGKQFPVEYKNQIFVAEHGSWNRSKKIGYRISLIRRDGNKVKSYEPFVTGWLQGEQAWGRPVDILEMPDGSLLISDDFAGVVYRLSYATKSSHQKNKQEPNLT